MPTARGKRPCKVCGKWFRVSPRRGDRHRVCSNPACQRERHRRNCAAWNQQQKEELREERLRDRLRGSEQAGGVGGRFDRKMAVATVGMENVVVMEEIGRLLATGSKT